MRIHTVPTNADGIPLERYIRRAYPMCSDTMLRNALKRRDFKLDGRRIGARDAVRGGGELQCYIADEYLFGPPFEVLYCDDSVAAIVKPQGISCQRDADGIGEDNVESRICAIFGSNARIVNRLDHYTGGVMPVALTDDAYFEMISAFRAHAVKKAYICVTVGCPEPHSARLVHYAVKSDDAFMRLYDVPVDGGLTMISSYEVIDCGEYPHVRVLLETGRTHQIRAQLSRIGYPVLGDDKYGDREANRRMNVHAQRLWCESIEFTSGSIAGMRFCAPSPF